MNRPAGLPDFDNPPLNEVVIGVQFAPIPGYQQIRAGEVWSLYRPDYPLVEEHQPLQPAFETFGPSSPTISFGLIAAPTHDRFWFLSPERDQLIQFQHDRLLHNWRKIPSASGEYPRYESMRLAFDSELNKLNDYSKSISRRDLQINQCEISYINHIPLNVNQRLTSLDEWLSFLKIEGHSPDDLVSTFRRVINDDKGLPYARFICEIATALGPAQELILIMTLTVRGTPKGSSLDAALSFLDRGREVIVNTFPLLTTPAAHQHWKRKQ